MDKLQELITKGTRAEDLKEFVGEWLKDEEASALDKLLNTSTPPEIVKSNIQAAYRMAGKLQAIINAGKIAERKTK